MRESPSENRVVYNTTCGRNDRLLSNIFCFMTECCTEMLKSSGSFNSL